MPTRRSLPTLDRMRAADRPAGRSRSTPIRSVHITGTNGKGSTAAMATALLGAQGLTVGTYTSPNLSRVNERMSRNGEPIDDAAFARGARVAGPAGAADGRAGHPVRAAHRGRPGLVRRRGRRRGRGRGRAGGPVGLHQRGRRRRGRAHQRQLRPHRGARAHPGGHRRGQVGHLQGRTAGWSSARPIPTLVALLRPGGRRRPGRPRSGSGATTSPAPPTGWPSVGG